MNTACDVCKAPLGTRLVEAGGPGTEPTPMTWMAISAGLTAALGLFAWFAKLHPLTLAVVMFYGPLIASYRARDNVVGHAAVGGLLGMFALLLLSFALAYDESRAVLLAAMRGEPSEDGRPGTSSPIVFLAGTLVLVAVIFPISLVGASVGEHLAGNRRRRPAAPAPAASEPAARLSDAELARFEL